MIPRSRNSPAGRRGIVLIIVLVVTVMLALAAYGFVVTTQTDHQASRATADRVQLQHLLESGCLVAEVWLRRPRETRYGESSDGLQDSSLGVDWNALPLSPQQETDSPTIGTITIGPPDQADTWPQSTFVDNATPGDNGALPVDVTSAESLPTTQLATSQGMSPFANESSKLHLESIREWDRRSPGTGRTTLMHLPGMTEQIADAILDWMDEDDIPREFGAERDRYAGASCLPRNAIPATLDELMLVQGITPQLLYGHSADSQFASPAMALGDTSVGGGDATASGGRGGWQRYLTVCSAERNESWEGRPRIYINHPNLVELHEQLTDRLPARVANYIIAVRQFGDPTHVETPAQDGLPDYTPDLSQSARYDIRSMLQLVNTVVTITSEDSSMTFNSPFDATNGSEEGPCGSWLDALTLESEPRLTGRVNVIDAPREVLAALPGMEPVLLDWIETRRQAAECRKNLLWLWSTTAVSRATIEGLEPWVTSGGDVFRFSVRASQPSRDVRRTILVTLDVSHPIAQRIAYQEIWSPPLAATSTIPSVPTSTKNSP